MEIELHQFDLRYSDLRRRDTHRERLLLASLADVGQLAPVVIVKGDSDRYVLVDGYKRIRALHRLRRDGAVALLWELSEVDALLLARLMRTADTDSALEQGWLLSELHARFALSAGELARRFDKSQSWVSRRLALVRELPASVQDLVRLGALPAHAAMKHLVPLARAKSPGWEELAAALGTHQLSTRQVGTLTTAWLTATDEGRKLIVERPLLALRAEAESRAPKEKSPAEQLRSELAALAAIARRAQRLVDEQVTRDARWLSTLVLGHVLDAASSETSALFTKLHPEVGHAG